jgi:hypothetical protein
MQHSIKVRGLNYHVNTLGDESGIPVYLLDSWAYVSMAFQFMADEMSFH